MIPARSEGVSGIGEITVIYPSIKLNSIPIPSKSPRKSSSIPSKSSAGIKDECGSSSFNIPVNAPFKTLFISTSSTYLS